MSLEPGSRLGLTGDQPPGVLAQVRGQGRPQRSLLGRAKQDDAGVGGDLLRLASQRIAEARREVVDASIGIDFSDDVRGVVGERS